MKRQHSKKSVEDKTRVEETLVLALLAVLVGLYALNTGLYGAALLALSQGVDEAPQPAKIEAVHVVAEDCPQCFSTDAIVAGLKEGGVLVSERRVDYRSAEGMELIKRYGIERVPALILKGETTKDPRLTTHLLRLGERQGDDFIVQNNPPYKNVLTGELLGAVKLVYLNDSSCAKCYDVRQHKEVLTGLGLYLADERFVDVRTTEGTELITKYNITTVPTILLSPDAQYYSSVGEVWPEVGTVESDGWHVFRNTAVMENWGGYKNVTA